MEHHMNYLAKAVNAVKDSYLFVIEGIAKNPQTTFWTVIGLLALSAVF